MAIAETIPDSQIAGVQQYSTQDPTGAGAPGVIVPPAVLQTLMATSTALAPPPSAPPPHPQVTALTSAIAGGLQFSFTQLTSPTPYNNVIVSYRIYRNKTANQFSGAQLIKTIPHDNSATQKVVQVQDLVGSNQTASYFCTSVDSTGQESSIPGSFQSGVVNSGTFNPNVTQATSSSTSAITIAVTTITGATVTLTTKGNSVLITAMCLVTWTAATIVTLNLFKDGVLTNAVAKGELTGTGGIQTLVITFLDSPTAASHTYDLRISAGAGASASLTGWADIQVIELG